MTGRSGRFFPGDLDLTLNWKLETDLTLESIEDEIASHALVSKADGSRVRVIAAGETWPLTQTKTVLREG